MPVYVLGGGAIGLVLAAALAKAGRNMLLVRTRGGGPPAGVMGISVRAEDGSAWSAAVRTIPLEELEQPHGVMVVTSKSHANGAVAARLREIGAAGPVVVLQNGMGVEEPFLAAGWDVHRCILYVTGRAAGEGMVDFRPVASCPIGVIRGERRELERCTALLDTPEFPFHAVEDIRRDIWKKTIINAVFNAICPLLDADNGIFSRDPRAMALAEEVLDECAVLAERQGIPLAKAELAESVLRISRGSAGVPISTLQDIRNGSPTEIASLNLELARIAAGLQPPVDLSRTELLGRLTLLRSQVAMGG